MMHNLVKKFHNTRLVLDCHRLGRLKTATSTENINMVQMTYVRSLRKSQRRASSELEINRSSVQRIMKELKLKNTTTTTTIYFNEVVFPSVLGLTSPMAFHNIFLHLNLSQASSLQSPFSLISSFNTSLHLFLGLPFTPSSSTCSVSILFIQHSSSLLST